MPLSDAIEAENIANAILLENNRRSDISLRDLIAAARAGNYLNKILTIRPIVGIVRDELKTCLAGTNGLI
jgi:hypothetical protein